MNNTPDQTKYITETLMGLVEGWLYGIHQSITTITRGGTVPPPHPGWPFPPGFPDGVFRIKENFNWWETNHQLGCQRKHGYFVNFEFQGHPEDWSPLSWTLTSGLIQLGSIQMDSRIYYDSTPFLGINAHFIIRCMLASISNRDILRVTSRVREDRSVMPPVWLEIFEARTATHGRLVEEFGRRVIHNPQCCRRSGCSVHFNQGGSPFCLDHSQGSRR
ncbi:hypothetical protein C8J56DRAFT_1162503 [Mycena floridula]|nr:hypothetical protein C8J56DRAFT_1162503 [Mycena floridula]